GRSGDLFKSRGALVAPQEIEDLIKRHSGVEQAYVAGVTDEVMGQVGAAWVVPDGDSILDPDEIRSYCRSHLAPFKVPRFVVISRADELPMTTTGKVQKFQLVEALEAENAEKSNDRP